MGWPLLFCARKLPRGHLAVEPPDLPGALTFKLLSQELRAGTAAHGRVVEADVAAAAAFAALRQAVAAGLDHGLAGLVAARAADAAAVLGVFALANTDGEIALTARDAVAGATAAAQTVSQHAAEVLQRSAGDFVLAAAVDLAAVRGLFELDAAARQHAPVRRLRLADLAWLNAGDRTGEWCDRRRTTFQQGGR
jgi:hypothetical protein